MVLFGITCELAARYAYPHLSKGVRRIEAERSGVRELRGGTGQPSVLIVGNSLFELGIKVPVIQEEMTGYCVRRYVVSNTWYVDWYYGLRRLFHEGVRPEVIVVGLSSLQLIAPRNEGDFGTHLLFETSDVVRAGRELHKDNTAVSEMYFASVSSYFGDREQIRKWLLTSYVLPDLPLLGQRIKPAAIPNPPAEEIVNRAEPRLARLKALCDSNGARLILVIPPTPRETAASAGAVEEAGRRAGVTVLAPIKPGELDDGYFPDGMHLNDAGAQRFTTSLSADLLKVLSPVPSAVAAQGTIRRSDQPPSRKLEIAAAPVPR